MSLSRKEFLQHMKSDKVETTMPKQGKADWDAILKSLKQTHAPLTRRQIWKFHVKEAVSMQRTRTILNQWYDEKKVLRIVWKSGYLWLFRIPKDYVWPDEIK